MKVFIHVACMLGMRRRSIRKAQLGEIEVTWLPIIDEIMDSIETSGLLKEPSLEIVRNHVGDLYRPNYDEYFAEETYPNIINRQVGTLQEFEFPTLQILHDHAISADPDELICYIHTKGASLIDNPKSKAWREGLIKKVILDWESCVDKLQTFDAIGPPPRGRASCYFRGNFWWAKAGFIAKQPRPVMSELGKHRQGAEYWLLNETRKSQQRQEGVFGYI